MELEIEEATTKLDRDDWFNIIIILLILALLSVFIYGIFIYNGDALDCLASPTIYYEQLKNVTCQCTSNELQQPYKFFRVNYSLVNSSSR